METAREFEDGRRRSTPHVDTHNVENSTCDLSVECGIVGKVLWRALIVLIVDMLCDVSVTLKNGRNVENSTFELSFDCGVIG